jgi:colicin import membrane protein
MASRADAEAKFAKAQERAREAAKVMSEVEAEARRVSENTARLKALRLARDARLAEEAKDAAVAKTAAAEAKAADKAAAAEAKAAAKAAKAAKPKAPRKKAK